MTQEVERCELCYDSIVLQTELSILFDIDDKDVWIPKSEIHNHNESEHTFEIPEWLAYKEDLL